jgi:hypothetical protein
LGALAASSTGTVSTVYQADPKPVETVAVTAAHANTSMNRGVNESRIFITRTNFHFQSNTTATSQPGIRFTS